MKIFLSVIISSAIGNFNTLKFTLKSLLEQKIKFPIEILVVNDGFDEKISKLVDSYKKYLNIRFIPREQDLCVSRSRNIGFVEANSDNLVFIDSDILLNPNALNYYYETLSKDKSLFIWGELSSKKVKFSRFTSMYKDFYDYMFSPRNIILYFKPYFSAASGNFATTKYVYELTKGFNEDFIGHGSEDTEFAYRLYKNNIKILFSLEAVAEHIVNERGVTNFYFEEYKKKNKELLDFILKDEIEEFYSLDKEIVLKELEYVSQKYMGEDIYNFYLTYLFNKKEKAS